MSNMASPACARRSTRTRCAPETLAVTTNLNINFLRKPEQADLIAETRLMKIGKRLVIGEVTIHADGNDAPVAHVTATYSVPPRKA
jgi:acyl-coenzyme A thioesterase PaaI-like protein